MYNLRVTLDDFADDLLDDWADDCVEDIVGVAIDMDFGGILILAVELIL